MIGKLILVINIPGLSPISINVSNAGIAFDFKNPTKSAENLAVAIFRLAKLIQ